MLDDDLFRLKEVSQTCAGKARTYSQRYLSFVPARSHHGDKAFMLHAYSQARERYSRIDRDVEELRRSIDEWDEIPWNAIEEVKHANAAHLTIIWVGDESFATHHEAERAAAEWMIRQLDAPDETNELEYILKLQERLRQWRVPDIFGAIDVEYRRSLAQLPEDAEPDFDATDSDEQAAESTPPESNSGDVGQYVGFVEMAAICGVDKRTVRNWYDAGDLPEPAIRPPAPVGLRARASWLL